MHPVLIASLAAAGLLAGWPQRAVIARLAVPADPQPVQDRPDPPDPPAWFRPLPLALAAGAVSAVLLGLLAARVHPALVLAAACWLALCAVPLAVIDVAVYRLPDRLTAAAYAGVAVLLLTAAAVSGALVRTAPGRAGRPGAGRASTCC